MKAIVVTDQAAGTAGMKLMERPEPQGAALANLSGANYGDVVVQVHASGFTGDELSWPSTCPQASEHLVGVHLHGDMTVMLENLLFF